MKVNQKGKKCSPGRKTKSKRAKLPTNIGVDKIADATQMYSDGMI